MTQIECKYFNRIIYRLKSLAYYFKSTVHKNAIKQSLLTVYEKIVPD